MKKKNKYVILNEKTSVVWSVINEINKKSLE